MEDCENKSNTSILSTVFPLREKLSNLYFQLLQASSYADNQEYNVFDINDKHYFDTTRCKAHIISVNLI